ncbi:MAG: HAD family hydrolase [Planctomycetota bacterium]
MATRAVIFNLYGTLVHETCQRAMLDATVRMAHELDVDPIRFASLWFHHAEQTPRERALAWIESNLERVCKDMEVELHPVLRRRLARQRDELMVQTLFPRQGALRGLAKMRGHGLKTAVVGDTPPDVPPLLQNTELVKHLDLVLLSTSNTWRHDDPRVLECVVKELGVPAQTCLFVSTGMGEDLHLAQSLGMTAVMLEPEMSESDRVIAGPPEQIRRVGTMLEVYWLATNQSFSAVA